MKQYHNFPERGKYANRVTYGLMLVAFLGKLIKESRGWKNSRLSGSEGKLDLITLLQEFHVQMLQSYAKFVSQIFFPELNAAAEFYKRLTQEVEQKKPGSRMLFARDEPKTSGDGSKTQIQLELELPPNDLLSELGICLPKNVQM